METQARERESDFYLIIWNRGKSNGTFTAKIDDRDDEKEVEGILQQA